MKGSVPAVEIVQHNRCAKYALPNGRYLDILDELFDDIYKWIQTDNYSPESGGVIVGYEDRETHNITLESVSQPHENDEKSRCHFTMKDLKHTIFLKKKQLCQSYYMGVWHTHPEDVPNPSSIDWNDWKSSIESEKSGADYIFFIIAGRKQIRIWAGSTISREIVELSECSKEDELYIKGVKG